MRSLIWNPLPSFPPKRESRNTEKTWIPACAGIAALLLALAHATTVCAEPPASLNPIMTNIGQTMSDAFPLIVAHHNLNGNEQKRLKSDVAQLVALFRAAEPFIKQRSDTYQVSYQLVLDQLAETQRALAGKNVLYARKRLYALPSICASCHTQDTALRTLFSGAERARFADDLAYADFNFFTRNYAEAEKYYDLALKSAREKTELEIIQPLQQLVTIYAQVLNQPGAGAEKLSQYTSIKGHTRTTSQHLDGWITGLRDLDSASAGKVDHPDFATLEKYVHQYLGSLQQPLPEVHVTPENETSRVWLRGQLYHYLNGKPARDDVPKVLYWLAVIDRSVGYGFYFSLADLYLKDCVYNYSDHPYARRCYDEYREYANYMYSGPAGSFIPKEVKNDLARMQRTLEKNKAGSP